VNRAPGQTILTPFRIALILGATTANDISNLFPLTYPVKPATTVFHPPADAVRQLLIGGRENDHKILVGSLIAREDVEVTLSASKLVARHLAILAMTGGGKTVAARRIIRELIRERSQQKRVNETEDRSVGADSEPDRKDRGKGKPAVLPKGADGIADVVQHVRTPSKTTAIENTPSI